MYIICIYIYIYKCKLYVYILYNILYLYVYIIYVYIIYVYFIYVYNIMWILIIKNHGPNVCGIYVIYMDSWCLLLLDYPSYGVASVNLRTLDLRFMIHNWLVVSTILKNISQWEGLSHILWKIKKFQTTNQIIYGYKSMKHIWASPLVLCGLSVLGYSTVQFAWLKEQTPCENGIHTSCWISKIHGSKAWLCTSSRGHWFTFATEHRITTRWLRPSCSSSTPMSSCDQKVGSMWVQELMYWQWGFTKQKHHQIFWWTVP